jgi:hypothetical protein
MSIPLRILELLERFRFLTREQMHRAGLECSADHLGEVLRSLEKRRHIGVVRPGVAPVVGRLAFVYYLREAGAAALAEANRLDLESVTWCEGTPELSHDREHRLACVDVHLWLARVLGGSLADFLPYYTTSRTAGRMRPSSRLVIDGRAFVPDALFSIEKQKERFGYALEVQRRKRGGDLRDQLTKHAHSVREKLAAERLGVDAVAVMFVVEDGRDLKVLRSTAATLAPLRGVLFGRTLASLGTAARFMDGWEAIA